MSWYYMQAFDNTDDPQYACHYNITTNPRYHDCPNCQHRSTCEICRALSVAGKVQLEPEIAEKHFNDFFKGE